LISQVELKSLFDYSPEHGEFIRKTTTNHNAKKGDVAGYVAKNGYRYLSIKNNKHLAHRLAWLYENGTMPTINIDHKDGNKLNNSIYNLRECNQSQNAANSKARGGLVGKKGVTLQSGKFRARIKVDGKNKHLGYFNTAELAHNAYCVASRLFFGKFHNTGET
jgi:hypothetical protein